MKTRGDEENKKKREMGDGGGPEGRELVECKGGGGVLVGCNQMRRFKFDTTQMLLLLLLPLSVETGRTYFSLL